MIKNSVFEMITDHGIDQRRAHAHVSSFRRIDRNSDDALKGGKTREDMPSSAFEASPSDRPFR